MTNAFSCQDDAESLVARYIENPRDDLRDVIMFQYSSLVERVARKFAGLEQHEDLVQVGYMGLLNALSKFDVNAGVRFNTYATYLVSGEIKHYLRDRAQTIRQPAWLQELRHKVGRTANVLSQTLGRVPTEAEIAAELGISPDTVVEVLQTQELLKVASLDAQPSEDEGESDVERLDAAEFCPEQLCFEDRMVLENAMKQLRDLERQVLLHFHFDAMNQTEIANKLGISCNYVSHILRQSLNKLRRILANEERKDQVLRRQAEDIDYEVTDALTGAYTEAYFHSRLEEELHRAAAVDGALGLAIVNFTGLERLKSFYGEESVLEFLASAAEFLNDSVRRLDVVCRYGESGYAIILPATGVHAAMVEERLVKKLEKWMSGRLPVQNTISLFVGGASFPSASQTAKGLIESATKAMRELDDAA